jgi:hypothetical protein
LYEIFPVEYVHQRKSTADIKMVPSEILGNANIELKKRWKSCKFQGCCFTRGQKRGLSGMEIPYGRGNPTFVRKYLCPLELMSVIIHGWEVISIVDSVNSLFRKGKRPGKLVRKMEMTVLKIDIKPLVYFFAIPGYISNPVLISFPVKFGIQPFFTVCILVIELGIEKKSLFFPLNAGNMVYGF